VEGGSPHEIIPSNLGTAGLTLLKISGSTLHGASKIDPASGELIFFGYDDAPPFLRYGVLDKSGRLIHSTEIDIPRAVMMHDFAITENYTLFLDLLSCFHHRGFSFMRTMVRESVSSPEWARTLK